MELLTTFNGVIPTAVLNYAAKHSLPVDKVYLVNNSFIGKSREKIQTRLNFKTDIDITLEKLCLYPSSSEQEGQITVLNYPATTKYFKDNALKTEVVDSGGLDFKVFYRNNKFYDFNIPLLNLIKETLNSNNLNTLVRLSLITLLHRYPRYNVTFTRDLLFCGINSDLIGFKAIDTKTGKIVLYVETGYLPKYVLSKIKHIYGASKVIYLKNRLTYNITKSMNEMSNFINLKNDFTTDPSKIAALKSPNRVDSMAFFAKNINDTESFTNKQEIHTINLTEVFAL